MPTTDAPASIPAFLECLSKLSGGAIAGIVIGSIAGVALLGYGSYFLYTKCYQVATSATTGEGTGVAQLPATAGGV